MPFSRHTTVLLALLLCSLSLLCQTNDKCGTALKSLDLQRYNEAVEKYKSNKINEAYADLLKINKRNPQNADVQFYLGLISVKKEDNKGIRKHFEKLFKICDDYPDGRAYLYQGIIYYSDEKYEEAVYSLNRFFDYANQQGTQETDALYMEASNYLYWSQFLANAYRNIAPFSPKIVLGASSNDDEMMPYMSLDGKEIYYIRFISESSRDAYYVRNLDKKTPYLCVSRWKDTTFNEGSILPAPFNTHESEGGVSMTADGKTIYISAMTRGAKGYANYDIYTTHLVDGKWTPLENAGKNVNGETSWEGQPSISADGQYLYFSSSRQGGLGATDIWRCKRLDNGDWGRAENLGSTVNTPGHEKCPFIHADGHTLYFASDGWQGFGGYDMYFSDLDDPISNIPTNLGLPINGENDDICFGVTTNGTQAYYAGRHPVRGLGGKDILIFDLYPAAQPEGMSLHNGTITNAAGRPLPATVAVRRPATTDAIYLNDSTNGKYAILLSLKECNIVAVESNGYFPYVSIGYIRKGQQLLPDKIVLKEAKANSTYPLPFTPSKGKLNDDDKRVLDIYIQYLINHPMVKIRIETPHSIDAQAIYDYMVQQKLRPSRLQYYGGGDIGTPQIKITEL